MGVTKNLTRRDVLAGFVAGAVVAGFDPIARHWVSRAEASGCPSFDRVPRLDGTLHLDEETRTANDTDQGNIVHQTPCAVLRPGSVNDIRKIVEFCRQHAIKVATRGQGHHMGGFGLSPGVLIEGRSLRTIHSIGSDYADVDMGVTWKELLEATVPMGLRPPVITGYAGLSVGGLLSVGGTSGAYDEGTKVEHVRELTLVTGRGDEIQCSDKKNRDLFNAALGGLGQCGITTRATVDLIPAEPMARSYQLQYTDNATYFQDLRTVLDRGELPYAFTLWFPTETGWVYQLNMASFYSPSHPPDDEFLLRDLSQPPAAAVKADFTFLDYALLVDRQVEFWRIALDWDRLLKPWLVVLLPDYAAEQYVGEVIANLTPTDLGPGGFIVLFSMKRATMNRPLPRVPDPTLGDWVHNFGVLTSSTLPGPDPVFSEQMLARNRRLYDAARAVGATLYPMGALPFTPDDWEDHFGNAWPAFVRSKRRFDPDNILTPGPEIFP